MINKIVIFEDADGGTRLLEKRDVIESIRLAINEIWGSGLNFPQIFVYFYNTLYELNKDKQFDQNTPVLMTEELKDMDLRQFYKREFSKQFEDAKENKNNVIFLVDYIILFDSLEDDNFSKEVVEEIIKANNNSEVSNYYCVLYTSQRWKDMKTFVKQKGHDHSIDNIRFLSYAEGDSLGTQYDFEDIFSSLDEENNKAVD